MPTTSVEKFHGLTDLPLYNREPGWCKTLENFRVRPGGYLEQRYGFDAIKPSGGTAADPISGGIFVGGHEHTMADGYIFTHDGSNYSANLAQRGQFQIWATGNNAAVVGDSIYIGSTIGRFSRVVFYIGQALAWATTAETFAYEYPTASDWSATAAFTLTTTPTFTSTGEQILEVQDPGSAWIASVRNGIYAYWMRITITSGGGTGIGTACRQGGTGTTVAPQKVYCDWPGAREIYVASANPGSGAGNGTLKYYGQSSASVVAWNSVSTSLFSGNYPRYRFASYRNLLYFVNGKEQKRWDGNTLADIGFSAPTSSGATASVAAAGNLNGAFSYYITYGYGPGGEWGESSYYDLQTGTTTPTPANNSVVWTLNLTSIPATAEAIYVYRTTDLTSVPASARGSFPYFRIATVYRDATGTFPTTITDDTVAFPFPPVELNIATLTPPSRCKFIAVHKNRLFLGGNNQYPGRVWWSEPFQAESFNTDENFADFTRSTGGLLTGMREFADQVVVFTEDKMFGIANVDQDQPSIYEIAAVGCIAPESLQSGYGSLMWAARDGIYRWTGEGLPVNVSTDIFNLQKLTREAHGGARAAIHNQMYDIYFIKADNSESAFTRYRYDFVTGTWSTVALGTLTRIGPLAVVTAPLGHADEGVRHPLYGATSTGGTDYKAYLGEMTNQDGGNNFTCTAEVLFGPRRDKKFVPKYMVANYGPGTSASFGSIALQFGNSSYIGPAPAAAASPTSDGSEEYTRVLCNATNRSTGVGGLLVQFIGTTQSATVTTPARLLALHLEAESKDGGQN